MSRNIYNNIRVKIDQYDCDTTKFSNEISFRIVESVQNQFICDNVDDFARKMFIDRLNQPIRDAESKLWSKVYDAKNIFDLKLLIAEFIDEVKFK